jgi:hypothetical protein
MTTAGQSRLSQWFAAGALMLAGAILALALIPNLVSAQTEEESDDATPPATEQWRGGGRMGPPHHLFHGLGDAVSVTTELTGTTTDDVIAALQEGSSLASYAEEQGVAREELTSAIVAAAQQEIDERVANGDITRERADELLAELDQRVEELVDRQGFAPRGDGCTDSDGDDQEGEETANESI